MLHFLFIHFLSLLYRLLLQKSLACVRDSLHLCWDSDPAPDFHIAGVVAVSARVLAQVISQIGADGSGEALWARSELTNLLVLKVPEFFEVRMLQKLGGRPPLVLIVYQHFLYYVRAVGGDVRNHFGKAFPLLLWEIDLHMRGMFPEEIEDLLAWSTNDIMNLVDLIEFVITWEQWAKGQDLVHDAAYAPDVHFVAVVAICEEALRSPVPTGGDVFGQRLVLVKSPTTS